MPTSRVLIACGGMCWPFVFPHVTLLGECGELEKFCLFCALDFVKY